MKIQGKKLHVNLLRDRALAAVLLLFTCLVLLSCGKKDNADQSIRIVLEDVLLEDGTTVQVPSFVSDDEQIQKNLRELEQQKKYLEKIAEKEQKKKNHLQMSCYLSEVKNYPQVTVVWKTKEKDGDFCDLVTLAADEKEGMPVTCKEALERTGMSGVELSLKVGRLAKEELAREKISGQLSSTEMQGFAIDEKGEVTEIFMKLIIKVEKEVEKEVENTEETVEEEHFFSYVPGGNSLVKLSEKGFDVP